MENTSDYTNNYLARLSFVGTRYHGTQIQENAVTVQEVFQKVLATVLGSCTDIKCCSRLDSGVHARDFCIGFFTRRSYACDKLQLALNGNLPPDIRVHSLTEVPMDFHARYASRGKTYEYLIWNGRTMDPFLEGRAHHFPRPADEEIMAEAAGVFLGTHDFSSFCSSRSDVEDKVRTVSLCRVDREGDLLRVTIRADGFLYNMARIMAGAILQTAAGKLTPADLAEYLNGRPRDNRLITLPACGLYLTEVSYDLEDGTNR